MKGLMRKMPGSQLVPESDELREMLKGIKNFDSVMVEVKRPRNLRFHKKYFALLNLAFDCQEKYTDRETFRQAVLLAAQVVNLIPTPGGGINAVPRSLSFGSMDEAEFGRVYQQCLTVICDRFVQGQDAAEMNGNVEMLLGEFA